MSYEEECTIIYEPVLEIFTTQIGSNDYGRLQLSYQGLNYQALMDGVYSGINVGTNGSVIASDGASGFQVSFVPNRKAIRLNNTVYAMTGTGSPEGSVSAPVRSLYLISDGAANTSMYIKESGVSVTGWVTK